MIGAHDGIGMTSRRTRDRLVSRLRERGIKSDRVLNAISEVPRHLFVDEAMATRAYEDTALPIGRSQTISQPYVVALMTEALLGDETQTLTRVLEVGTGSGYQAAILGQLVEQVFSVERIDELSRLARRRFRELGYRNIRAKQADGHEGWPAHAPFDAIMVTAGGSDVPPALFEQLADGGTLVAPLGPHGKQQLIRFQRQGKRIKRTDLGAVVFVPLLSGLE